MIKSHYFQPLSSPIERRGTLLGLHAAQETQQFWDAIRRVLHEAVPDHFVCMGLRPFVIEPPTIFRERAPFSSAADFKEFQDTNPIHPFLAAHPGMTLVRMSNVISSTTLVRSTFYRQFMRPLDKRYFAGLNLWRSGIFQGMIGLHRTTRNNDFSDGELDSLEQLHPHFEMVWQRIVDLHRERAARLSLEKLVNTHPNALALLDWDLNIVCRNRSALELCTRWNWMMNFDSNIKDAELVRLPPEVMTHCRSIKAEWKPSHACIAHLGMAGVCIQHPQQPNLRASISLIELDAAPLSMPMFLVRLENGGRMEAAEPSPLEELARLSVREREVALLVSKGNTNEEVAHQLNKSVATVKKQLRSIFQKLDVSNRGRLMALLYDSRSRDRVAGQQTQVHNERGKDHFLFPSAPAAALAEK